MTPGYSAHARAYADRNRSSNGIQDVLSSQNSQTTVNVPKANPIQLERPLVLQQAKNSQFKDFRVAPRMERSLEPILENKNAQAAHLQKITSI